MIIYLESTINLLISSSERSKQTEIENRAKQINKECYTNQDIEIIVFGNTQE